MFLGGWRLEEGWRLRVKIEMGDCLDALRAIYQEEKKADSLWVENIMFDQSTRQYMCRLRSCKRGFPFSSD